MNLKRFKRGGDRNSDQLLKWIEEGCFDALSKKYLKTAVLTVLSDSTSRPDNVIETYTLRVNYPESVLHQSIDAATANIAHLSLTRNDRSVLKVDATPTNFRDSVSKILRSLCVMSQTLKNLPERKCLSMKLSYYDEVTPMGYEPPGFVAAEFDIDHLFQGPTNKYSFGAAKTPYHDLGLSMETVCDDTLRPSKANSTTDSQAFVCGSDNQSRLSQQPGDFNESIMIASQVAQAPVSQKESTKIKDVESEASFSAPNFPQSQHQSTPAKGVEEEEEGRVFASQSIQRIKCVCGNIEKELEMIQCDACSYWQHAVCSGYVSSRDRRLDNSIYSCCYCRFGTQLRTFKFVKELSIFRKILAVLSFEGFTTMIRLYTRVGLSKCTILPHVSRLVREGFLLKKKTHSFTTYTVAKKDENIKEKIKKYFNQNLTVHPEFVEAQEFDNGETKSKRRSETNVDDMNSLIDTTKPDTTTTKKPVPIEISSNTVPFEVKDPVGDGKAIDNDLTSKSSKVAGKVMATSANIATPPSSASKMIKKRKISVPSERISCYMNN